MKQHSCQRDRPRWLGNDTGRFQHHPRRGANLLIADRKDPVGKAEDVLEVECAERLCAQAIAQCARGLRSRPLDQRARAERLGGVGCKLRLAPPYLRRRTPCGLCRQLDPGGHARQQPTPRDRRKHQLHARQLFQNLHSARSLSRDDRRIVIRWHHRVPVHRRKLFGLLPALAAGIAHQHNLGAQRNRRIALDLRRIRRHHNHRLRAQRARRIRHALRMVARGVGDDAAPQLLARELRNLVVCAAQFETADRLRGLVLQVNRRSALGELPKPRHA